MDHVFPGAMTHRETERMKDRRSVLLTLRLADVTGTYNRTVVTLYGTSFLVYLPSLHDGR